MSSFILRVRVVAGSPRPGMMLSSVRDRLSDEAHEGAGSSCKQNPIPPPKEGKRGVSCLCSWGAGWPGHSAGAELLHASMQPGHQKCTLGPAWGASEGELRLQRCGAEVDAVVLQLCRLWGLSYPTALGPALALRPWSGEGVGVFHTVVIGNCFT